MPEAPDNSTTRRGWIAKTVVAGGVLAASAGGMEWCRWRRAAAEHPFQGGTLLGTIPFEGEGRAPLDTPNGDELDGRQFLDLSHLEGSPLVTPTDLFYIRTRASHLLDISRPWSIRVAGPAGAARIAMDELRRQATPQGLHLMECAGNTRAVCFGMISVASWDGVPLAGLLDRMGFDQRNGILVSGFDEYAAPPRTPSVPGASWIFRRDEIAKSRAFLATAMNGQPLTPDHGAPVRLVLPGWYGCACIKWVNQIATVDEDAEATSQMREYAARTMQRGMPRLASEYFPATIDPAAMAIRVEKWRVAGKIRYRVVGIVWGGSQPAGRLEIRFAQAEPFFPVSRVLPAEQRPWTLWSHLWRPPEAGIYQIRLRLADRRVRTRRLDQGFYVRQVRIDEI